MTALANIALAFLTQRSVRATADMASATREYVKLGKGRAGAIRFRESAIDAALQKAEVKPLRR